MNMKIVYFDYCAVFVLITILVSQYSRHLTHGKEYTAFLAVNWQLLIKTLVGCFCIILDNLQASPAARFIFHGLYLILHPLSSLFYTYYIMILIDSWYKVYLQKLKYSLLFLPMLTIIISVIINIFTKHLYYIDANDVYVKSKWVLLNYFMVGINITYSAYLVLKYRNLFPKRTYASIVAIYPLILFPMITEFFNQNIVIEPFGNALGILLIALSIQRPEELLDFKTGFFSRDSYIENFNKAKINNKRTCHIFVNISNYRNLRNIIGYDTGFELSTFISQLIRKNLAPLKIHPDLYYLKNGEFRIVLGPGYLNRAKEAAEIINNIFLKSFYYKDIELNFISNICLIRVPEEINTLETLFNFGKDLLNPKFHTGEILYAKDIYRTDYYQELQHLDKIMEKGFINGNYSVHYQPIFDTNTKTFNSVEAFLRLNDNRYGYIDLENLIPAAEKSGIIHRMDNFVVEEVCKFIKSPEFEETGLNSVTVNFSLIHCIQDNFPSQYLEILDRYKVPTNKIVMELSESDVSTVHDKLIENLKALNEAGVPLSIDNFGKSYSNTQRLGLIQFNIIKFDKSLVKTIEQPRVAILLKKMIEVARAINVKIAVIGIETPANLSFFEKEDCDYLQGYFFTRPIPEKHLLRFLKNAREKKLTLIE